MRILGEIHGHHLGSDAVASKQIRRPHRVDATALAGEKVELVCDESLEGVQEKREARVREESQDRVQECRQLALLRGRVTRTRRTRLTARVGMLQENVQPETVRVEQLVREYTRLEGEVTQD